MGKNTPKYPITIKQIFTNELNNGANTIINTSVSVRFPKALSAIY